MTTTKEVSKHYSAVLRVALTDEQRELGIAEVKLDPYQIFKVYQIGNAAVEHIAKKALRWTSKGDDPRKVLTEIIATANRELELLDASFLPNRTLEDIANGKKDAGEWKDYDFTNPPPIPQEKLLDLKFKNGAMLCGVTSGESLPQPVEEIACWRFSKRQPI